MILDLEVLRKENLSLAGGKGAGLGELVSIGIRVPKAFVITADAYDKYLAFNGIQRNSEGWMSGDKLNEKYILELAKDLRDRILRGTIPEDIKISILEKYTSFGKNARVAVRSSATAEDLPDASFAGQQETFLNVCGEQELLEKIRLCYASLWGDRAVMYRYSQDFAENSPSMALVIQEMIECEKSGVMFTANPITGNKEEVQIDASYGLGESIVGGRVSADSYLFGKDGTLISCKLGDKKTQIVYGESGTKEEDLRAEKRNQRVLSNQEIRELVAPGLQIESHYGMPMDIEWGIKGHDIYILQARAITTLGSGEEDRIMQEYLSGIKIKKVLRPSMIFLLEKVPFAFRAFEFDLMMTIATQKEVIFEECGFVYRMSPTMDEDGIMNIPNEKRKINRNIVKVFQKIRSLKNLKACAELCDVIMHRYQIEKSRLESFEIEKMGVKECGHFLRSCYDFLGDLAYHRFKYAIFPTVLRESYFTKMIKKVDKSLSAYDFYRGLNNKTSVVTRDMLGMADFIRNQSDLKDAILSGRNLEELNEDFPEFQNLMSKFLSKNGFKSDYNCYCLEGKSFLEDPIRVLNIIRPILSESGQSYSDEKKEKSFSSIMDNLKPIYGDKYAKIEEEVLCFRTFHEVREETQYIWESIFYYVRKCVTRVNQLLLGNEDYKSGVGNLFYEEMIQALERGGLSESDRERIRRRNEKFPLANKVWEASKALIFEVKGDVLKGVSGSPGITVGRACIIRGPEEFYKMKKGDVLVCHLTDPEWTPLFKLASAVVADTGAALSHAAIVAREFKIPAVLGVGYASQSFRDGDMILVDGDKGLVKASRNASGQSD